MMGKRKKTECVRARKPQRAAGAPTVKARGPLPSWQNAKTDLEAARRQLAQALPAVERAATEMAALRESSATVARMEIARALVAGPNGGALSALAALAEGHVATTEAAAQVGRMTLVELCRALGVTRVGTVGEPVEAAALAEMNVLGGAPVNAATSYAVAKAGWRLGEDILFRPTVTPVRAGERP